jgi:hypothetical protein
MARRLAVDLDEQRAAWERERDQEMARLTEASRALARSWHELEQHQREFESGLMRSRSQSPLANAVRRGAAPVPAAAASGSAHSADSMDVFEMRQLQASIHRHSRRR